MAVADLKNEYENFTIVTVTQKQWPELVMRAIHLNFTLLSTLPKLLDGLK